MVKHLLQGLLGAGVSVARDVGLLSVWRDSIFKVLVL